MLAVGGIYQNGSIKLDNEVSSSNPVRVIITFLEDVEAVKEKRIELSDLSFAKSRALTANYQGSFSESLVEERRSEL